MAPEHGYSSEAVHIARGLEMDPEMRAAVLKYLTERCGQPERYSNEQGDRVAHLASELTKAQRRGDRYYGR
jgi:hypothetical protein